MDQETPNEKTTSTHEGPSTDKKETPPAPSALVAPPRNPAGGIDISKIILPTKEVHDPLNAERVSAGILLEQEQTATLPKTSAPPRAPIPPKQRDFVESLETYQSDIEKIVTQGHVSAITAVAAEAVRRQETPIQELVGEPRSNAVLWNVGWQVLAVVLGIVLISIAGGLIAFSYLRNTSLPPAPTVQAPLVAVDGTSVVLFDPTAGPSADMAALLNAKNSVATPVGLVTQLVPALATTTSTSPTPLDAQTFLADIAPDIPPVFLRSVQPAFLLGVHSFDVNQPFLVLSVDSYEQGYAGMLAWESTMQQDLSPLFNYTPSAHIPEQGIATSSATSAPEIIPGAFTDRIVENHDARVIQNQYGDISFLWTFLDKNTILITTNSDTVKEIVSRLKNAPSISIPGQ